MSEYLALAVSTKKYLQFIRYVMWYDNYHVDVKFTKQYIQKFYALASVDKHFSKYDQKQIIYSHFEFNQLWINEKFSHEYDIMDETCL